MSDPVKSAPAPPNPSLVIRELEHARAITIFSVPFSRGNLVPIGGRSTAIKLADGSVFLLASHPLCPETLATLRKLGPVKHLVAPDLEHNMYIPQFSAAFPEAHVYAPDTLVCKWDKGDGPMKGKTDFVYGRGGKCTLSDRTAGEIQSVDFGKAFVNEDIAFLHVPTKTLIQADLLFNLPCREQYSKTTQKSTFPFLTNSMRPGTALHKRALWYAMDKDRVGMAKSAKAVSAWDFDRIIPCHGDVIETGGKKAWDETYAWYLRSSL